MRFSVASQSNPIQGALLRSLETHGELSVGALRSLSPLSEDAQKVVDNAVVEVGLQRLIVTADLLAAGMRVPLNDPLSVTEYAWDLVNQTGGAQRVMNPSARGENQMPDRIQRKIPVYLTTDDFNIGIRTLRMSQRVGQPLDLTQVQQATRRVNEAIEDSVLNGAGITIAGSTAPGILNAPNANTHTITTTWSDPTTIANFTAGPRILGDVVAAIGKLQTDKKFGPYRMYVGTNYGLALDNDYKANGSDTIRQRLENIQAGGQNFQIRVADQMPANTAVIVQMTSDVVQILDGLRPTLFPWTSNDGFTLYWMVMAIMVPIVRDDYDGNSGIVILSV